MSDAFIYAGGPWGNQGTFGQLGFSNPNFPSDADHTATLGENGEVSGGMLYVTSSVTLTAIHNLILPLVQGMAFDVFNDTEGGQNIYVVGSSGDGVLVEPGAIVRCVCTDGANYQSESEIDAAFIYYEPDAPSDWQTPPDNVAEALDALSDMVNVYPGNHVLIGGVESGSTSQGVGSVVIGQECTMTSVGGNPGVAIGAGASAVDYSVAIGIDTAANAEESSGVAIGYGANVGGANGVAVGTSLNTEGADSVAIGNSQTVNSQGSVCIGNQNNDEGVMGGNVAIGQSNDTSDDGENGGSVAIGYQNNSEYEGDVAIGHGNFANGAAFASAAIGINNAAIGEGSVSIGYNNSTADDPSQQGQVLLGYDNDTSLLAGVAIGFTCLSEGGIAAIAVGNSCNASGNAAVAIGDSCVADGDGGVAVGYECHAEANGAVALGSGAVAGDISAVAIGLGATASVESGIAIGENAACGESNIAIGYGCTSSDDADVCIGYSAQAAGGIAIGYEANAAGGDLTNQSIAIGHEANATVASSTAIGSYCATTQLGQLATGFNATPLLVGERSHSSGNPTDGSFDLRDVPMMLNPLGISAASLPFTLTDGNPFNLATFLSGIFIGVMTVNIRATVFSQTDQGVQTFIQTFNLFCNSFGVWTLEGNGVQAKFGSASMNTWTLVASLSGTDLLFTVTPPAAKQYTGIARVEFEFLEQPS